MKLFVDLIVEGCRLPMGFGWTSLFCPHTRGKQIRNSSEDCLTASPSSSHKLNDAVEGVSVGRVDGSRWVVVALAV